MTVSRPPAAPVLGLAPVGLLMVIDEVAVVVVEEVVVVLEERGGGSGGLGGITPWEFSDIFKQLKMSELKIGGNAVENTRLVDAAVD